MINIAIDGPSGSGKSTVAKILSKKLDILYLDTGAMYRACGLKAKLLGLDCSSEEQVATFIDDIDLKVEYENGEQQVYLDGENVSKKIRKNEVSMLASTISTLPIVRKKMVQMQREVAKRQSCILDGRDICMYVLPDAKYKFYVTATPSVRATRRHKELMQNGQEVDYETIFQEINARDRQDTNRKAAPLSIAPDAEVIDTSFMTIEQVADYIIKRVSEGESK